MCAGTGPVGVARLTDSSPKFRAFVISFVVTVSAFGGVFAFSGTGFAHTTSAGNVAVGDAVSVDVADATIDPSNESRVPVAVNLSSTGLQPSEVRLRAVNTDVPDDAPEEDEVVNSSLLSDADFDSNASSGNITLRTSPITGPRASFTLNVSAYDVNTGAPIPGAANESTITVDDTTAPAISNVSLTNDGFDKFRLTFDSSEAIGALPGNLSVTVTGPNGATYSFDRLDFFLADRSGNFTYQLNKLRSFDDGGGAYTVSVDTAEDHFGNDGAGGAPTATHVYTTDFSDKSVANRPGGPDLDTGNVTMFTTKIQNQFLLVRLENDTANFARRDISGEGADENTELWVNFTVAGFNPDVLMGTANVDSWNYTVNPDGSADVNVSLRPASTERNFTAWQDGVNTPANWGAGYDGSDQSMDAVVDFGVANLSVGGGGGPAGLDGARLTTDAQVFDVPRLDEEGNLTIDVASPHCVADTSAPADECTGDEVNDGGFYEAVIPSTFYQEAWGVDELSSGDVDVEYDSGSSGDSGASWEVTVREDGALILNGTNIHYSEGTVEISQAESDDSGDDGGTSGGGGSASTTVVTADRTGDGTTATIERVTLDDPTVSVAVEGATTETVAVTEVTASFETGTNSDNTLSVGTSDSRPDGTPVPPGDRVLGFVTVDVEGNLAEDVAGGSFTLDLADGDVGLQDVTAHRYHDGEWEALDVDAVGDTTVSVTTPGFSVFAIGADVPAEQATETTTPATTATPTPSTTSTTTATPSRTTASTPPTTEAGGMPGFGLGAGLVALLVVAALAGRKG